MENITDLELLCAGVLFAFVAVSIMYNFNNMDDEN